MEKFVKTGLGHPATVHFLKQGWAVHATAIAALVVVLVVGYILAVLPAPPD
jgi:hypothetical protein